MEQSRQVAINILKISHTDIHQALNKLTNASPSEIHSLKPELALIISRLANAIAIL
jgi:hypothetical protein